MKKYVIPLIISLTFILLIVGCTRDEIGDQTTIDEDQNMLAPSRQENKLEKINLEDLEEKLLGSVGIELKNTDNQAIGLLKEREHIVSFIEELFQYPQQEKLPNDSSKDAVIGPINFYFNEEEGIYGIVKNGYIYIEGYYFLMSDRDAAKIENLFSKSIIEAPVSGN
ncbi:hypothetical protein [Alkaliphilus hydrothermalis]|uniref:Lipoprotein n=1 Tax=Alkaliphilus hydrothermalis TaxID=1482730 RepID=A0ABS2NNY9_9FIRM|nr:hypothetical protein [Alkaliphilus hydrothermalis]MBM7614622.1 hypothetical protein [Alkaliphilus hydrothermalis]